MFLQENRKYAMYKNMNCNEICNTYGKLFSDAGDSTKYALSPSKLSQRGFDLGTDSDKDDGGDKLPINAEARTYALEATDGDIEHMSDWDMSSDEDVLQQLEEDIITWLEYCGIAEHIVRDYLAPNTARVQDVSFDVYALHAYSAR
ncbi:Hypothetical predicted protein [Olea europaea subsp. europaea]|uniref:Uncharacterized protein n=1 Tax=Olea europaea subsp. europaea TaxID=158383 RepID=A0A8S0RHT6_OLEEU|nr:Hypothetical predicted protein [Olea europaea subsp. europaea]